MIRNLEKTDFKKIQKLFANQYKAYFTNRPDMFYNRQPITANYFEQMLSTQDFYCFVYEENKKLLGAITFVIEHTPPLITLKKRKIYKVSNIVIDPNYRFKNIGAQLCEFVENLAIKNKVDSIEFSPYSFQFEEIKSLEAFGMTAQKITYEKILTQDIISSSKPLTINTTDKII